MPQSQTKAEGALHPSPTGKGEYDGEIDKDFMYGNYQRSENQKANQDVEDRKLYRRTVAKAMDMAEPSEGDAMGDVSANRTSVTNGVGWKELAAIGVLGLGVSSFFVDKKPEAPAPVPVQEFKDTDTDTKYGIGFTN